MLPARHDLALLLVTDPARRAEAFVLWKEILQESPDYLPSLVSLAENSKGAEAVEYWRRVLALKPGYVAAPRALADALLEAGDPAVLEKLRQTTQSDPRNASAFEQLGDAEATHGAKAEARAAYQRALDLSTSRSDRNRIREKLRRL